MQIVGALVDTEVWMKLLAAASVRNRWRAGGLFIWYKF